MLKKPNFILFITDQQRFDHLGCYGHPILKTPNIDAIAKEGVIYDRFYVSSPVCMPNRASLMTCRLPSSHGVRSLGIPLGVENVTFVELLRAAGYETALIGKSHIQNVTNWPAQFEKREYRPGFSVPPNSMRQAIRANIDSELYHYEQQKFWDKADPKVPTPFYGFDHYVSVLRHGANSGGDFLIWLEKNAPEILNLMGKENQFEHNYTCPQAVRTKIPEEYYSTQYIANRAADWIRERDEKKPFFLMISFPDPHHPFTPPGKYWDMYSPEDMPIPKAFAINDWSAPEYVRLAERARARDETLGQSSGYTVAVSMREALEARALTCGMIAMVDNAVGQVRNVLTQSYLAENTIQIYTSDHGDHLGDHKLLFKGAEQYDALTHVPFIWSDPKGSCNQRTSDIAQTHDIGSTILERASIEAPEGMQGQIMAVAGGMGRDSALIQYDNQRTQEAFGKEPRVHTIIHNDWRLSLYRGICKNEMFNLKDDPDEMYNLWDCKKLNSIKSDLIQKMAELQINAVDRVPLPTAQG